MIDRLRATKSAYFYKQKKKLPKQSIADLFRQIRQNSNNPSRNVFQAVKSQASHALWSGLCFFYERDPVFLELPERHTKERVCGFILLVEFRKHCVVFKSNLDIPSSFKKEFFQRVSDLKVEAAIGHTGATFEQIRLRNMASSKYAMKYKTLEANDLQSVVGPAGASRYVPRGYRVRRGIEHYTATPNSGRISQRAERADYEELVRWAMQVIDLLVDDNIESAAFIRGFARPIDLDSIPHGVVPTHLAVDVQALTEQLFEVDERMSLVRKTANGDLLLSKEEVDHLLSALDQSFVIREMGGTLMVVDPANDSEVGSLNIGKSRISLRDFNLPEINGVFVRPENVVAGEDVPGVPLRRYIDRNDVYTILFNDVSILYLDGSLYKDDSLSDGTQFLAYIHADSRLNAVTSEKGTFAPDHRRFDMNSVFGAIVDSVGIRESMLMCDDLGDEWADFIGLNVTSQPKTISFYHAKHDAPSLSASALHIVVSQAIKNLGRLNLSAGDVQGKQAKWNGRYVNNGANTQINRIIRGEAANMLETIRIASSSPDTIRRVFIVTSSLSRQQLVQEFADIRAGESPLPHFVQMYWLLISFFSACTEVGAQPYVFCQD